MNPLTIAEIRGSICNSSKSRVKSMTIPQDLVERPWDDLDFLGWVDAKSPSRAYVVASDESGAVGIELRVPKSGARGSSALCDICHCTRPNAEVALYVAPKAGAAGKNGNSIGTYICADLACSLNARGLRTLELTQPEPPGETKVAGVRRRFEAFIAQVRMP